jgi:hypothetical protein
MIGRFVAEAYPLRMKARKKSLSEWKALEIPH